MGNLKGVGRTYQQSFIDSYCKVTMFKRYYLKLAITAADILNEGVDGTRNAALRCYAFLPIAVLSTVAPANTTNTSCVWIRASEHTKTIQKKPTDQWHLRPLSSDHPV